MPIGFGDEDWKGRKRADLWRTCVRSLIHDIPATLAAILSARLRVSRARPLVLIDLHRRPSSAGSGRPVTVFASSAARRELWLRPRLCGWPAGGQTTASRGQSSRRPTRLMVSIGSRARCRGRWRRDLDSWLSTLTCQPSPASPSTARWPSSVVAASALIRSFLVSRDRRGGRAAAFRPKHWPRRARRDATSLLLL